VRDRRLRRRSRAPGAPLLALVLFAAGCRALAPIPPGGSPGPLRLSDLAQQGDAQRRASLRLILEGLDAEAAGAEDRGVVLYERSLGLDATNPFAYLALARHYAAREDAARALQNLDQAEVLLAAEGGYDPRLEAHLLGLRGAALASAGQWEESRALLERARERAPIEWADGRLSPAELR